MLPAMLMKGLHERQKMNVHTFERRLRKKEQHEQHAL
jgi:hypothetical protein